MVELLDHLLECRVHVAVAAALAEGGRTRNDNLTGGVGLQRGQSERRAHAVGRQLARAGQFARHAAADGQRCGQDAAQRLLDQRLTLLDDQQRAALLGHAADLLRGHGVLRNLEYRIGASVGIVLHQVVVADAAGNDAHRGVTPLGAGVEAALDGFALTGRILLEELLVAVARVARHEHPLPRLGGVVQFVLGLGLPHLDHGARVGHAGGQAHQYGNAVALREFEGLLHHLVGLLLRRGLEDGDERELAVKARVLLVLRGVHRGVVCRHDHQAAVGPGHRRVDEGVGRHVHAHVLHADQRPLAGERHAEGLLHGGLFVGRPEAVDAPLLGEGAALDVFGDFGRGGTRVGVDARQTRVEGSQCESFVSE